MDGDGAPRKPASKEYPMEVVDRAEELYCVDGHTFEGVSSLLGIAASTLKRWSDRYSWQEKKERIRQARSAIRADLIVARAAGLGKYLDSLEAKDAFAVAALEKTAQAWLKLQETPPPASVPASAPDEETGGPIRADSPIEALRAAMELKLRQMLVNPAQALTLQTLKEFAAMRELLSKMEADGTRGQEITGRAPDAETLKELRTTLGL